jgi:DNA polymerase-3 subunit gamma/tau
VSTEVLYRKWRPRRFSDVAGQDAVSRTLRNAVATGKVSHAYLFAGPRGTGKTSTGRILAKAVNCLDPQDGEPCDTCTSCRDFNGGRAMDLVELDAASNRGIDEIRSLRDKAGFAPNTARYKVYLVDEVHMLTDAAANALLKTLEEPPPHVIFILATTDAHRLPATIISRCQRFDFRRISVPAVVDRLAYICEQEGFSVEPAALDLIARTATGSLRDGVNLLDQVVAHSGPVITLESAQAGLGLVADGRSLDLARALLAGDLAGALRTLASVCDDGVDMRQFQRETVTLLRQLLLLSAGADDGGIPEEKKADYRALLAQVPAETIVRVLRAIAAADLRADPHSSLPLELAAAEALLLNGAGTARQDGLAPTPSPRSGSMSAREPAERPAPARAAAVRPDPSEPAGPRQREEVAATSEVADAPPPSSPRETAVTPAPAVPDHDAVEAIRARWADLYRVTKSFSVKAGALLNSACDIISADNGTIVLGFKHTMHLEKMVSGDGGANLIALQKAIEKVIGSGWTVRCEHHPDLTERPARTAPAKSPLVELARSSGARIVNRK